MLKAYKKSISWAFRNLNATRLSNINKNHLYTQQNLFTTMQKSTYKLQDMFIFSTKSRRRLMSNVFEMDTISEVSILSEFGGKRGCGLHAPSSSRDGSAFSELSLSRWREDNFFCLFFFSPLGRE